MIGTENAYACSGDTLDFAASADHPANDVVKIGALVGVTRRPFRAGELATCALVGVFNLPIATAFAATIGADALYDFEAKTLVGTGGSKIGVYFDAVVSGDTFASVKLS